MNEGTTLFPLKQQQLNLGRTVQFIQDRKNVCLISDEASYIYKKVETDSLVNVETIKQEIEEDGLDNDNEAENPDQNVINNDFDRFNVHVNTSQMEQWSILSNVINYVQYNRNPRDYYKLDVKALESKTIGKYMTG